MHVTKFIFILSSVILLGECAMEPFVVGGNDAKIVDFPYVAYLGVECVETEVELLASWGCGSSILNQFVTLTAGHCLFGCMNTSLLVLYAGHENILKGGMTIAHSFLIHEYYSHIWLANDIALVRLKTPLVFSRSISRVALMENPPYKEVAKLAGWGVVNEDPIKASHVLQFTKQRVWETQNCLDVLKRLPEGTFCARSKDGSSFASAGDSGSPLVVRDYIQIGLVSSKTAKYSANVVTYTDVGFFYHWIEENVITMMCPTT